VRLPSVPALGERRDLVAGEDHLTLVGEMPKKVRVVSPARAVICGTVVAANPCAAKSSRAARSSRPRTPGVHLLTIVERT
jgi:hypothetical protein